ncbi:unnamed protein product, partial [Brassica oleracea]
MRKLGYHSVTFYGDSSELYDTLSRNLSQGRNNILKGSQCPTYMEGIAILAIGEEYNFYFQKNKSSSNVVADALSRRKLATVVTPEGDEQVLRYQSRLFICSYLDTDLEL